MYMITKCQVEDWNQMQNIKKIVKVLTFYISSNSSQQFSFTYTLNWSLLYQDHYIFTLHYLYIPGEEKELPRFTMRLSWSFQTKHSHKNDLQGAPFSSCLRYICRVDHQTG